MIYNGKGKLLSGKMKVKGSYFLKGVEVNCIYRTFRRRVILPNDH